MSNPETILEPERRTPVLGAYDVVIVGGGIAGVAAAVASARVGASTALVEKESALGGLATLGNVVKYLPLCDGAGNKVCGGLAEELGRLAVQEGGGEMPDCWQDGGDFQARRRTRFVLTFNPVSYLLALEQTVVEAGVDLWYDTRLCAVTKRDGALEALSVENKSGRNALRCKAVVDASGDADVCTLAGEETVSHDTNVACGWFHYAKGGQVHLQPLTQPFAFDPSGLPEGVRGYSGTDGRDVTAQILESRRLIRQRLERLRADAPHIRLSPVFVPTIATFRMTRRLKGELELSLADAGRHFPDSVGVAAHWRKKGVVFQIPLRALAAAHTRNLLAAGRCVSARGECWDVLRVIVPAAVTGEAAGTAAALAAGLCAGEIAALNTETLQARLVSQGVPLASSSVGSQR